MYREGSVKKHPIMFVIMKVTGCQYLSPYLIYSLNIVHTSTKTVGQIRQNIFFFFL